MHAKINPYDPPLPDNQEQESPTNRLKELFQKHKKKILAISFTTAAIVGWSLWNTASKRKKQVRPINDAGNIELIEGVELDSEPIMNSIKDDAQGKKNSPLEEIDAETLFSPIEP